MAVNRAAQLRKALTLRGLMMKAAAVLVAVFATAILLPAHASAAQECGATITSDVTLTESLTGCGDTGLVIGADDVVLDLNGHTIAGVGAEGSVGVEAVGRARVTVKNGTIKGFARGVQFEDATWSHILNNTLRSVVITGSSDTAVSNNTISGGGVRASSSYRTSITSNTIDGAETGVAIDHSSDTLVERNQVTANGRGVTAFFGGGATIRQNTVNANQSEGIFVVRTTANVEGNTANQNGTVGIASSDSHGQYTNNIVNKNGWAGLSISDSQLDHMQFFTVGGNVANANGEYGIWVRAPGAVVEVKNRARANGLEQCVNLPCN